MAAVRTTEAPQFSSDPELPTSRDAPDETSPLLLGTSHARQSGHSERRHSARSSVSTFFDENAGLLLVAASQFFYAATNTCVKWLNSLDGEPVPMLEVRRRIPAWLRVGCFLSCQ